MMWPILESVVGQLKVAAGQLVVAPSRSERTADLLARQLGDDPWHDCRCYVALPSSLVAVVHAAERWLGAGFIIIVLVN